MLKSKSGQLYVVATPIGNLEDITLRALKKLKEANLIVTEDTRVTRKLLEHYQIKKPLLSYHHHSSFFRLEKIISYLQEGYQIVLVTDAGTPGVADPGNQLVKEVLKKKIKVKAIPGASALTALISIAGLNLQQFVFLGFPPHKKGRQKFFQELEALIEKRPVIFYESKYRFLKTLETLSKKNLKLIIGRELTKIYEEVYRGTSVEAWKYYQNNHQKIKGEFTLIIYK